MLTGQKYPTAAVTAAESPWLDNDWNTPGNIVADDGNTANVIDASYGFPDQTFVLKASGFDFSSIPDGSIINGVICRVNAFYRSGQGSGSLDLLQLLDASLAKVGTNQCSPSVALTTTITTIITKGSAADKWGNALDAAWVKSANFGVALGIRATNANADVDVDYVTLEIDYTPPEQHSGSGAISGGGSVSGSGTKSGAGAAQVSGSGILAAVVIAGMLSAAVFSGGGILAGLAEKATSGVAAVSGGGSIAASAIKEGKGTAVASGGGTLAATGVAGQSESHSGAAALSGGGTLAGLAEKATFGVAAVSGGGSIAASAVKEGKGSAVASGGGTLAATGVAGQSESHSGTASLSGGGSVLAYGCGSLPFPAVVCEVDPLERLVETSGLRELPETERLDRYAEVDPLDRITET